MICVVQRVLRASVEIEAFTYRRQIGPGLCVLLGVETGDDEADAAWMAGKLARLRIFRDDEGKMNRSVQNIGGELLLVSQFTLTGDCSKGNRPSFVAAADPDLAKNLYERVCAALESKHGLTVKTGVFGEMMSVELVNDGPVTLILRTEPVRNP